MLEYLYKSIESFNYGKLHSYDIYSKSHDSLAYSITWKKNRMLRSMLSLSNRIKRPTFLVHATIAELLMQILEFLLIVMSAMHWAPTFTRNELRCIAIGRNRMYRVLLI